MHEITLNTLKIHNERLSDLIAEIESHFGWQPVHPKESMETIIYRAGQASVVEYINTLINEEEI